MIDRRHLLAAAAGAAWTAHVQARPRHDGGVAYVEGVRDAAASRDTADLNLALRFEDVGGRPLDDVALQVLDARGEVVLDLHSADAPLLARLEPGRYRVRATLHGLEQVRDVDVPADGRATLQLRWRDPLPTTR
jgi:hypothetical protein